MYLISRPYVQQRSHVFCIFRGVLQHIHITVCITKKYYFLIFVIKEFKISLKFSKRLNQIGRRSIPGRYYKQLSFGRFNFNTNKFQISLRDDLKNHRHTQPPHSHVYPYPAYVEHTHRYPSMGIDYEKYLLASLVNSTTNPNGF